MIVLAKRRSGFTLIELLVVLAIILTLVGLLAAGLGTAREKAKSKATRALIGQIQTALENYFSEFRDYPPDGYDIEVAGTNNQGVPVGHPPRRLRGTAALMYYLCRPLVKVTYMGPPNETLDKRNWRYTPVGPFLTMTGTGNYSRGRADDPQGAFDPAFVWADPSGGGGGKAQEFWVTREMFKTEITDGYYRPLCYDKVKTDQSKYFQPNRFHNINASGTGGSVGYNVHPDTEYLQNEMPVLDDDEFICPNDDPNHMATSAAADRYKWHVDPRFKPGQAAPDGCSPNSLTQGTSNSHAPRNVGGYDLWSYGRSYTNPRDDITSWGE